MTRENQHFRVRRILVPVDESAHSRTALEAATVLAAALQADISCLFVEDEKLLKLAQHTFFREVCTHECRPRPAEELERDLKRQSERIRRMIAGAIGGMGISWALDIRRGVVEAVILEQATSADLIVMGRLGRSLLGSTMGSVARHHILHGRGQTMFIQEGFRLNSPILTVFTGSALSQRALALAAGIAGVIGGELEILLPAADRQSLRELKAAAAEHPAAAAVRKRYQPLDLPLARGLLARLFQSTQRELLVLPADAAADPRPEGVLELISRINNPVLLIRNEHPPPNT
ncbi:universal stress protein [Desulfurivibrio sp. C05AmB]|uniref:universal stress protein n=1 Tax=Desulfurivibrio sp. C05AmB TaxID=3374371 RepID=UPI00376EB8EE